MERSRGPRGNLEGEHEHGAALERPPVVEQHSCHSLLLVHAPCSHPFGSEAWPAGGQRAVASRPWRPQQRQLHLVVGATQGALQNHIVPFEEDAPFDALASRRRGGERELQRGKELDGRHVLRHDHKAVAAINVALRHVQDSVRAEEKEEAFPSASKVQAAARVHGVAMGNACRSAGEARAREGGSAGEISKTIVGEGAKQSVFLVALCGSKKDNKEVCRRAVVHGGSECSVGKGALFAEKGQSVPGVPRVRAMQNGVAKKAALRRPARCGCPDVHYQSNGKVAVWSLSVLGVVSYTATRDDVNASYPERQLHFTKTAPYSQKGGGPRSSAPL